MRMNLHPIVTMLARSLCSYCGCRYHVTCCGRRYDVACCGRRYRQLASSVITAELSAGNTVLDLLFKAELVVHRTAMQSIHNSPVPTIAKVNGAAGGGGFGLALACDITIAARSAFFVATFGPRLGIVPDLGTTWNLPHKVGRARAMGIAMLGGRISAEQAEDWGLIWKCVDDEKLDEEVDQVTNLLSRTSAEAMTRIRSSIDAAANNTFSEQLDLEMEHQSVLIPKNMQAAAKAFMEKEDPSFESR